MSRIIQVRRHPVGLLDDINWSPAACAGAICKTTRAVSRYHACVGEYGRVLVRWDVYYCLLPA